MNALWQSPDWMDSGTGAKLASFQACFLGGCRPGEAPAGEGEERALLPTEDRFLRLDDMENFVQDAEAAAMRGIDLDKSASESENEAEDESGAQ